MCVAFLGGGNLSLALLASLGVDDGQAGSNPKVRFADNPVAANRWAKLTASITSVLPTTCPGKASALSY